MSVHNMTRSQLLALPVKSVPVVDEAIGISLFDDDGQAWAVWSDDDGDCRTPDASTKPHGRYVIHNGSFAE